MISLIQACFRTAFKISHQRRCQIPDYLHLLLADDVMEHPDVWLVVHLLLLGRLQLQKGVAAVVQVALQLGHERLGLYEMKIQSSNLGHLFHGNLYSTIEALNMDYNLIFTQPPIVSLEYFLTLSSSPLHSALNLGMSSS